jgi:16S rRNA (uracil1498-N3)-methyltransferase
MQVFFAPDITGNEYILDRNESKHIVRVLRMVSGDRVKLIDGKGSLFEGVIENADQMECSIRITGVVRNFETRNYRLHIAISPLKNAERFEWFVEKSVEIGIDQITPLICRNTEKQSVKTERIGNIIISAMKQSLKSSLTVLNQPVPFDEFIRSANEGNRLIAHCNDTLSRKKMQDVYTGGDALILIGPEGDFTGSEINNAISSGFTGIHLGTSRLRTETAGIAACHSVYFINQ